MSTPVVGRLWEGPARWCSNSFREEMRSLGDVGQDALRGCGPEPLLETRAERSINRRGRPAGRSEGPHAWDSSTSGLISQKSCQSSQKTMALTVTVYHGEETG